MRSGSGVARPPGNQRRRSGRRGRGGWGDDGLTHRGPAGGTAADAAARRRRGPRRCSSGGRPPAEVAAAHPESRWRGPTSPTRRTRAAPVVESYAYARVGYHRGLDQLRRNGWKGHGPVPWEHEPNRGFLRCLHALGRAAGAIGETAEAERCATFLRDSSPAAADAARPVTLTAEGPQCPPSCSSAPSGATRARARPPTCSASRSTTSSSSTAATTPATRSSSTARSTPCTCCPPGILTPGVVPVIGNGVVIDLGVLFEEIDALQARGVDTSRAGRQRQRARHPVVQPHARQGHRAVPRQPPHRHHRPRHRPDVRRQDEPRRHPRAGPLRREDPAAEGRAARSSRRTSCS